MKRKLLFSMTFLLGAALGSFADPAQATPMYTITELGPSSRKAYGINELGQIVGDGPSGGFFWEAGVNTPIPSGGVDWAFDVNEHGSVAGGFDHGYQWAQGTLTWLPTFGGSASTARAINDQGRVVGSATFPGGFQSHAFVYESGVITDLGTLGGPESLAFGVNNTGLIVGVADTPEELFPGYYAPQAFLYENGAMQPIASQFSKAYDINDSGQVVGQDGNTRAFLWDNGVVTDLGTLGSSSEALAINNIGQIVGYSLSGGYTSAFLWEEGVMYDVNDVIPADSGWLRLFSAEDINDAGQIVGWGQLSTGGPPRAFLLTPIPEPGAFVLGLIGGLIILCRRRG